MKNVLTESQIGKITDAVNESRIASTELKEELIDHLCCMAEDEMSKGKDFETAYQVILKRVYPNGLGELQNEMLFLSTSKSRKRLDRTLYVSGLIALTGVLATVVTKLLHVPFAQLGFLATACVIIFAFLPSLFFRQLRQVSGKKFISYTCGFVGALLLVISIVFFIFHWPASLFIMLLAVVCIYVALLPLFFFRIFKKLR